MNKRQTISVLLLLLAFGSAAAMATDVEVRNAWVRGTVAGQQATGAFMDISSKSGATLVGASSPAAAVTEIHEMKMDGQGDADARRSAPRAAGRQDGPAAERGRRDVRSGSNSRC